jgi:hypothetical protein
MQGAQGFFVSVAFKHAAHQLESPTEGFEYLVTYLRCMHSRTGSLFFHDYSPTSSSSVTLHPKDRSFNGPSPVRKEDIIVL